MNLELTLELTPAVFISDLLLSDPANQTADPASRNCTILFPSGIFHTTSAGDTKRAYWLFIHSCFTAQAAVADHIFYVEFIYHIFISSFMLPSDWRRFKNTRC